MNPSIPAIEDGFGEATMAELVELRKALEVGYTNPPTGFDSIRVESLESTLKLLSFSAQHTKFWNEIQKVDAFSTVEEYNRLEQYGGLGQSGFVGSGVLPDEEDSTYSRQVQKVKYLGTTRSVHHPATLIRSVPADLIGQETQNGALYIMGRANNALYYGDDQAIPLSWSGVTQQIVTAAPNAVQPNGAVIDAKGAALTSAQVEEAARRIADNFGLATALFTAPKVLQDFAATYNQFQRFLGPNVQSGYVGTPVSGYNALSGKVDFFGDVFVKEGGAPPGAATHAKAPNAPTLAVGAAGADSDPENSFFAADAATYKWQVTAINQFGESAPSALSSGVAIAAGQKVTLTITDTGGTFGATGYRVYRSRAGETPATWLIHQQVMRNGGPTGPYSSPTTWDDQNKWRPKTYIGLMLDMSAQSLTFKQLAPMLKMNLAIIAPAIRWMQLLYGTPIVFAPKKNIVIRNIAGV